MHANYQIGYFLLFSKLKLHKIYLFLILCGLIFTNRSKNCKIRKLYVEICTQISIPYRGKKPRGKVTNFRR